MYTPQQYPSNPFSPTQPSDLNPFYHAQDPNRIYMMEQPVKQRQKRKMDDGAEHRAKRQNVNAPPLGYNMSIQSHSMSIITPPVTQTHQCPVIPTNTVTVAASPEEEYPFSGQSVYPSGAGGAFVGGMFFDDELSSDEDMAMATDPAPRAHQQCHGEVGRHFTQVEIFGMEGEAEMDSGTEPYIQQLSFGHMQQQYPGVPLTPQASPSQERHLTPAFQSIAAPFHSSGFAQNGVQYGNPQPLQPPQPNNGFGHMF